MQRVSFYNFSDGTVKKLTGLVFFAFLFLNLSDAAGDVRQIDIHQDAYSDRELQRTINDYQSQSSVLKKRIQSVKKEVDWLTLKINRISEAGRSVPYRLKTSIVSKKKKVMLLEKEKTQLDKVLFRYTAALKAAKADLKTNSAKKAGVSVSVGSPVSRKGANSPPQMSALPAEKNNKIEAAIEKAGLGDWVAVTEADGGCAKVRNTLPILFSSGSAVLAKEYSQFLKKLADFLKPYDVKVVVSGYADSDPIKTKQFPSNFELGASRAATVVHEMVRYGLKPSIFKIGSTGEYRFAARQGTNKKSFQRQAKVTVVFNS